MSTLSHSSHKRIWLGLLGTLFMLAVGFTLGKVVFDDSCMYEFRLINKELNCEGKYEIKKHDYSEFETTLDAYLAHEQSLGRLTRYAVYFRDLENGPIFGINEDENFVPASLLKLPILLAILKLAETEPTILDQQLVFEWVSAPELVPHYPPQVTLEPGKEYSIREITHTMIAYSDNASYQVLLQYLRKRDPSGIVYLDTLRQIGLIEPSNNIDATLSAKEYGSIFRTLYNGSYLSLDMSELALEFLSDSDFDVGIASGVPDDIAVANKFGERYATDNMDWAVLHDCGIVYFPKNPYLLCVMVEGHEFSVLESVISAVSRMTYVEIRSRRI